MLLLLFYILFLKAFVRTGVLAVFVFWEVWQGKGIFIVFPVKVYIRNAVFRFSCSIYTFVFTALIRTRVFSFLVKVLMRAGVLRAFSFIYILYFQTFIRTTSCIKLFCQTFYKVQSFYSFLLHLYFFFKSFIKVMSDTSKLVGFIWSKEKLFPK